MVSPVCGIAPVRNEMELLESVKSRPSFISKPFLETATLVEGLGMLAKVNVTFEPLTNPEGISASTKVGVGALPAVPQAPELPSTCKQSVKFPIAPSTDPFEFNTAARETAKA